jgi:hypothetical protein
MQLKSSKTSTFDLYEGDFFSIIKQIKPVHCVILRSFNKEIIDAIPLVPTGNLWIAVQDIRNKDGSLSNLPILPDWFLADKVYWRVGKTPVGVLEGEKDCRYLGSSGMFLRFTRIEPLRAWANFKKIKDSCWDRTLSEEASWYSRQIESTCPTDGIVLDPICKNGFVAEAAFLLGRQFVGIHNDVKLAQNRINDIVGKFV